MLKVKIGNVTYLGLSRENCEHLQDQHPLWVHGKPLGLDHNILIVWDEAGGSRLRPEDRIAIIALTSLQIEKMLHGAGVEFTFPDPCSTTPRLGPIRVIAGETDDAIATKFR